MNSEQILILLNTMSRFKHAVSAEECAKALNISTSAFKKDLRDLKPILSNNGCKIVGKSGLGNGYELIIENTKRYETYMNQILPKKIADNSSDYNEQKNRIYYIMDVLLNTKDYIKSEDISDKLAISRSQFAKDLTKVKKYFSDYRLSLVSKSHYGIRVQGDEIAIRMCMANIYTHSIYFDDNNEIFLKPEPSYNKELEKIREIIIESADHENYQLNDLVVHNLVVHLYIAIKRMESNNHVKLQESIKNQILAEEERPLAEMIIEQVEQAFQIKFDKEEICYIIMHLSAKKTIKDDNQITTEVMEIVAEMLDRINRKYCVDLKNNLNLRIMIGLHTVPLLHRLEYHLILKNPLLEEIKRNLLQAYEMAICGCEVLNERFHCDISEDEISYFALHIKVAMDENRQKKKKRILLVCSTGRGSAQLLRYDFQKKFKDELESIETCNVFELSEKDFSNYDCIFTTVLINMHLPIPIFNIKYFLDVESEKMVAKVLQEENDNMPGKYFDKDLFWGNIEAANKEEVIETIIERTGEIRTLPPDMKEAVFRREKAGNTQFGKMVAMPHPDGIIGDENIISVCVLKNPVEWGMGKIQVVIFMTLAKNFTKNHEEIFRIISELIHNKKYISKLISNPDFETFISIINKIDGEEKNNGRK